MVDVTSRRPPLLFFGLIDKHDVIHYELFPYVQIPLLRFSRTLICESGRCRRRAQVRLGSCRPPPPSSSFLLGLRRKSVRHSRARIAHRCSRLQTYFCQRSECLIQMAHRSRFSSFGLTSRFRYPPLQLRVSGVAARWRCCDCLSLSFFGLTLRVAFRLGCLAVALQLVMLGLDVGFSPWISVCVPWHSDNVLPLVTTVSLFCWSMSYHGSGTNDVCAIFFCPSHFFTGPSFFFLVVHVSTLCDSKRWHQDSIHYGLLPASPKKHFT